MMIVALIVLAVVLLALLVYWELAVAEGVHLGQRVVTLLYDLTASRYNDIKQFTPSYEAWFLGEPLALALSHIPEPLVLDVATGTGRLPITLLKQVGFRGKIIGLDSSRAMLAQAARDTHDIADRLTLVWQGVNHLPFDDDVFDAVTCMEALEFFPETREALREIIRVLRPGGLVLVTNRVGAWAKFLPGHTQSRPVFEAMLASLGLERIHTQTWQVEYDLVWAFKPGQATGLKARSPAEIWRCSCCGRQLECVDDVVICGACGRVYRIALDGVIELAGGARR